MGSWDDFGDIKYSTSESTSESSTKSNSKSNTKSTAKSNRVTTEKHTQSARSSSSSIPSQTPNFNFNPSIATTTIDQQQQEKRQVPYTILKNKGIQSRSARINRNPRVKKRVKYEKALTKLSTIKKSVSALDGRYSGEKSGIRDDISRSRKFS